MVSPKLKNILRATFAAFKKQSLDDSLYHCEGALGDLVFDLVTIDSGIAGIASRIIEDGPAITFEERTLILERTFLDGTIWKGNNCVYYDLIDQPLLLAYVKNMENLRILCLNTLKTI